MMIFSQKQNILQWWFMQPHIQQQQVSLCELSSAVFHKRSVWYICEKNTVHESICASVGQQVILCQCEVKGVWRWAAVAAAVGLAWGWLGVPSCRTGVQQEERGFASLTLQMSPPQKYSSTSTRKQEGGNMLWSCILKRWESYIFKGELNIKIYCIWQSRDLWAIQSVMLCLSCPPVSKQSDPYSRPSRPLGLGPRLVRDSDLELKKAERRGGSSWVTAGIPRSLPAASEQWGWLGVRDRQRCAVGGDIAQSLGVGKYGRGPAGMSEAACHPGRSTFLQGGLDEQQRQHAASLPYIFPGFKFSFFLSQHKKGWRLTAEQDSGLQANSCRSYTSRQSM